MIEITNSVDAGGPEAAIDVDLLMPTTNHAFPFIRRLDFTPVLELWEALARTERGIDAASAEAMRRQMESVPGLLGPIDDLAVVQRNHTIVAKLMSVVMPAGLWETSFTGAFLPFDERPILVTPRLQTLIAEEDSKPDSSLRLGLETREEKMLLDGYLTIAERFYGWQFDHHDPVMVVSIDAATGLNRYFRLDIDHRFIRPVRAGDIPRATDAQIRDLRENVTSLERWRAAIPDGTFEFRGVRLVTAVDITAQEILSRLRHNLIDGDASTARDRFVQVQQRVRELLREPDLVIVDDAGELILDLLEQTTRSSTENVHTISGLYVRHSEEDPAPTSVDRALSSVRAQVTEDLAAESNLPAMERRVLARGLRSLLVVPLVCDQKAIGTLNLASPSPGAMTAQSETALRDVASMFAMALRRSREEMNNRTEAIIRARYTAIHPAIEWRFRRAAGRIISAESRGIIVEPEEIAFDGIHPLYAVSDMRGSSHLRNLAIRADLQEQLRLALGVVRSAMALRTRPVLDHMAFRIERSIERLDDGIDSGDESTLLDFLRHEIEPVFDHFGGMNADVTEHVIRYRAAVDPDLGMVHRQRKAFEESVTSLNRVISSYLDEEQRKAQSLCPHYFEKHETDGVDFGMYVGAALLEDRLFDPLCLKDLRLWQFLTLCGIARRAALAKPTLPVPLDMTHLILVQTTPLSIRYRLDEKRFDVDGAYNVRYEIMKKRIDKALVMGTTERLTQPETIAVVYSNAREAVEYGEYIEYLQSAGHLFEGVEDLELEALQEVQGLRALRVRVSIDA